jgi:regulator of protease activity HflC (stomatin/prohibitin superfamily)
MTINGILKIVAGLGLVITLAIFAFSGTTIKPGEEGTLFDSFGDGMETEMVYTEGYVPHLPWKEMIVYNVQNKSYKYQAKVLDKDGTEITVFVTVSASIKRGRSPFIHLKHGIGYEKSVIDERIAGAIKDVIGKYGYEQIYGAMRDKLEGEIDALVRKSLGKEDILVAFTEVKDVNLPEDIQAAIIAKQTQDQLNLKAEKLKVYEDNIASANVASAKGRYDAAEYDAKTKAIMSQPKMLALKQLEIEQIWAEKGVSPYGNNNVFGAGTTVVKGLK